MRRVLITVRTYPTPAEKGIEVSCTAGVTAEFPVPYRFLDEDQRFTKYQWIELKVSKATSDPRPESYNPDLTSIKVASKPLSTTRSWAARKEIVLPLKAHCLCCLQRSRDETKIPTLGLIHPKLIKRLLIEKDTPAWSPDQLAKLQRLPLFGSMPKNTLEKIPLRFKYEFSCDDGSCPGHELSCTDWEMGQAFRRWKRKYGSDWERYFRQKFEFEMVEKKDTHFYVGTIHGHPATWIIVGLFYPPS